MPHREQYTMSSEGGGAAGLYAALLLQRENHRVHVFEGTNRVGGRIYTHHFSTQANQYFEAGAMRIPDSKFHTITFQLINYLNSFPRIGNHDDRKHQLARNTPWLGVGFLEKLQGPDFEEAFWQEIVQKFDNFTFRQYLLDVMAWPVDVIDFVETVTGQTGQFALSVTEMVMHSMDFRTEKWETINHGMSRLPDAMAFLLGHQNITYGARVTGIVEVEGGQVELRTCGRQAKVNVKFDKVILAIPPAALRMLVDRPRWDVPKELAIRSMSFEPFYKMGLRFKTRFWEQLENEDRPSMGGQSTTDLPIRWIVFPSNGIETDGPGVLIVYAWMKDATTWLPLTPFERQRVALHCLAEVYAFTTARLPTDVTWATSSATGTAMFSPGQFQQRFKPARQREGNVYFAGEHLSHHHMWISGALDSALCTVRDMLEKPELEPLCPEVKPLLIGAVDLEESAPEVDFEIISNDPVYEVSSIKVELGLTDTDAKRLPTRLGAVDPFMFCGTVVALGGMN
ncbi:hypothetical protein VNI00_013131 [Paramarasmius palmivorus]|uniref:Amine oxidase domain-containing protein n=1 Tax=Paramarasmius palmivorus TaxID=297713 RepID=A0AAW0C086_9AGAR